MRLVQQITFDVVERHALTEQQQQGILALCFQAWGEDFALLWPTSTHVLAYVDGHVASHALWITRWLQPADAAPLRTAYVEAVVTDAAYQGRGLATAVMQQIHAHIADFDLGGLSPARYGLYSRLGWELWRGPLSVRTPTGSIDTPDEEVMILRLPRTPALDLDAPLSVEWRAGELW
jgi:aminoglycoside 2'-N-acetyltransferase I